MITNLLSKLLQKTKNFTSKEEVAEFLKITPLALEAFEQKYQNLFGDTVSEHFFKVNAKQASSMRTNNFITPCDATEREKLLRDIVQELKGMTAVWRYDGSDVSTSLMNQEIGKEIVSLERIQTFPPEMQPDFTGYYAKRDISDFSYIILVDHLRKMEAETDPKKKQLYYNMFRQGLDILDLDYVTYQMIGMNHNSIGYWLPRVIEDIIKSGFFKVPKTTIFKVPLSMLQLTRNEYMKLTRITLDIVDRFVFDVCNLDESKDYFIKTGTYSSKFDFRNAKVSGEKEVRELGEYLLFIHYQACQMASPLSNPCFFGVSTTNEWVVREFISDKEDNPCIYHGLPLHTEYRIFVDFDTKEVLGINPYWDSSVMKQSLGMKNDPDSVHDYVVYAAHEETLMQRYNENKDKIVAEIQAFLNQNESMTGQWSMDIMQNGDDFWFIDMADAMNSALADCVPKGKLKKNPENWIPSFSCIQEEDQSKTV